MQLELYNQSKSRSHLLKLPVTAVLALQIQTKLKLRGVNRIYLVSVGVLLYFEAKLKLELCSHFSKPGICICRVVRQ